MSALLQDLLRQSTISDTLRDKERDREDVSDDEELVGVVRSSPPSTPAIKLIHMHVLGLPPRHTITNAALVAPTIPPAFGALISIRTDEWSIEI